MRLPHLLVCGVLGLLVAFGAGCASKTKKPKYDKAVVRFVLEAGPREMGTQLRLPESGVVVNVTPKAQFSEYDVQSCEVANTEFGKGLVFQFTQAAGRDLLRVSVPNQGLRIVTLLNGAPIGARRIDGPLATGYFVTNVEVSSVDIEKLAKDITLTSTELREELEKKQK